MKCVFRAIYLIQQQHKSFSSATFQVMMMMIPRFQTLRSSAICTIQKQLALEENLQKKNPTID
jgi:ABC-type cobalamin transport system ATPase subunit